MQPGVYKAKKKNGTIYYRSSITYHGSHVSLGSFDTEEDAHRAYIEADSIYKDPSVTIEDKKDNDSSSLLKFDKIISIINHRDHDIYIKTPIYLRTGYFSYFLDWDTELKFDNDDLFYYSSHRILRRQGHLYVNDYGMQYSILARFGIKPFGVKNKDYKFANGDPFDLRYENIIIINKYHGVTRKLKNGTYLFEARIHLNGDFLIGRYKEDCIAAVSYNKAVDFAKDHGYKKQFIQNFVYEYSPKQYAEVYTRISLPSSFKEYILSVTSS